MGIVAKNLLRVIRSAFKIALFRNNLLTDQPPGALAFSTCVSVVFPEQAGNYRRGIFRIYFTAHDFQMGEICQANSALDASGLGGNALPRTVPLGCDAKPQMKAIYIAGSGPFFATNSSSSPLPLEPSRYSTA